MNAERDGPVALQETDRELILRFFAMEGHMADYRMPLSSFLNDEADRGIHLDESALHHRRDLFKKALHNVGHHLLCSCTLSCVQSLLVHDAVTGSADQFQPRRHLACMRMVPGQHADNYLMDGRCMLCLGMPPSRRMTALPS